MHLTESFEKRFCMPSDLTEFPWFEAVRYVPAVGQEGWDLRDCNPGSAEEEERDCVWAVLEAYEPKRRKKQAGATAAFTQSEADMAARSSACQGMGIEATRRAT